MQGQRRARAVAPRPPSRQPSGYSSASFYDDTSLSSSLNPTSDSDFECPSSSEATSFSEETSSPRLARTRGSPSVSGVAASSSEQTPPSDSEFSSSPVEPPLLRFSSSPCSEDAASPSSACGVAGFPAHSSEAEEGGDNTDHSGLSWAAGWPCGSPASSPRSPAEASGPTESGLTSTPGSGPFRRPQRGAHQESTSGSDTDPGDPVRRVVYSPRITLKDWRGECACWHEKGRASRESQPTCTQVDLLQLTRATGERLAARPLQKTLERAFQ